MRIPPYGQFVPSETDACRVPRSPLAVAWSCSATCTCSIVTRSSRIILFHCPAPQLQELAQEVEGAPEEAATVGGGGADVGSESAAVRRQLHALAARAAIEEDMMMRVPLSKVCCFPCPGCEH